MRYFRIFLIILVCVFVTSCGSSKKVKGPPPVPQPEWVKSRPTSSTHYIGIGWARKTVDVNQYQQTAKQNAQADLAGEISVNISSNSALYAMELNQNFREEYIKTIRSEIQEEIEAFEVIDSWEDETSYWIYYRLSKAEHQRLKELKKANAVTRSLDLYGKGIDALTVANVRLGLVHLIQSLEPIKNYLSEPLTADFRGENIYLGSAIFSELSSNLSAIEVIPTSPETVSKTGKGIAPSQLDFYVKHKSKGNVYEFPVVASYSEKPIRNNQKRTNQNGNVSFEVDIIRSTKPFETFIVSVDLDALILEATTDQFIRRIVNRLPHSEGSVKIDIQKPILHIISYESALGEKIISGVLAETFTKKAIENGFLVKEKVEEADYIVRIVASTSKQGESGSYKNVIMNGSISIESLSGDQLYHKPLDDIKAKHFEYISASDEAFKEARRRIEISIFREANEAIKRSSF